MRAFGAGRVEPLAEGGHALWGALVGTERRLLFDNNQGQVVREMLLHELLSNEEWAAGSETRRIWHGGQMVWRGLAKKSTIVEESISPGG